MSRAFWDTAVLSAVFAAIAWHLGAPPLGALIAWAWALGLVGTIDIQRRKNR